MVSKRLLVIHSYTQEYGWSKLQHQGFMQTLQSEPQFSFEIATEYLDTKRLTLDASYRALFHHYLAAKYHNFNADALYVTDDNALSFVMESNASYLGDTPIFFSGVNDLATIERLDKRRVRGVFEHKELAPNIELIKLFSPQTREVWVIGDDSQTYRAIERQMRQEVAAFSNFSVHFVADARIDKVIDALPKRARTFVLLSTIGAYVDE
ncbi:MAG: hypothetical protein JXK05_02720 [Campylobacterales bacterium]|nr:hypothetical protein [Campylobacterales bacterium]